MVPSSSSSTSTPSSARSVTDKASNYFESLFLELAPGATQGMFVSIIGHPFDTIKTRAQDAAFYFKKDKHNKVKSTINSKAKEQRQMLYSFLAVTKDTYQNQGGVRAFYRGFTVPLILKSAQRSLQYSLWDYLKAEPFSMDPFSSGAIVGAVGTVVIGCPAHVIKIHSQVSEKKMNAFYTTLALLRSERGIFKSFFAGLPVNVLKDTVFASTYLGLYDTYKKKIRPGCTAAESACVASAFVWLVFLPLDTLKTVLQSPHYNEKTTNNSNNTSSSSSSTNKSATAPSSSSSSPGTLLQRTSTFIQKNGTKELVRRLWTGLLPALMRAGPANALAMTSYEYVKAWCAPKKKEMREWREKNKYRQQQK